MSVQLAIPPDAGHWIPTRDGDPSVRALYDRHYSRRRYRDGREPALFVGPGGKIVLRTAAGDALFVWRKFRSMDRQTGVNCAAFRNESATRSSDLIVEAETFARGGWPAERFYTYVNAARIRSTNPGYCFVCAGWRRCGRTKGGLFVLEKLPDEVTA